MAAKPHLLLHSNAPWAGTGYGQQTALFAPKLAERYGLTISAFYGLEGNIVPWNSIPVLPGISGQYGNETIQEHVRTVFGQDPRSGLVMTLMDAWVLDPAVWQQFNTCCWTPVDHQPVPDAVKGFFERSGAIPIAMSRFGEQELVDLDPLYCPHGVDTEAYRPIDQAEAREAVGMPSDAFIVGMVAANKGNPSRKCFQEAFEAFAALYKRHPDTRLYLHSETSGRFQGVNLLKLLDACGVPMQAVIFTDQYRAVHFPQNAETMAHVYNGLDVLLAASAGEGFGIPVIEAQACGVPVIVSDFSAQPELVGAGWTVEGTKTYTAIGSWQFRPDVGDIVEALTAAYSSKGDELYAKKARQKAEEYDADKVFADYMLPALAEVQNRYEARAPKTLKAAA